MRFSIDVPDEIVQAVREGYSSRRVVASMFKISEYTARLYLDSIKSGTLIHVEQPKVDVESGSTVKALLLPDIHWPYHDQRALDAAIDYGIKVGCSIFLIQGDGFDCYYVSSFRKDPLRPQFHAERKISTQLFEDFTRQIGDVRKIFLCGNHEERIQSYIWTQAPAFADVKALSVPALYGLDELGWEFVSNKELKRAGCSPFKLGKCFIFHGHEIGMSGGAKRAEGRKTLRGSIILKTRCARSMPIIIKKTLLSSRSQAEIWTVAGRSGAFASWHPIMRPSISGGMGSG